jgi:HTH-type transcriptional regulator/antitoxin HipB
VTIRSIRDLAAAVRGRRRDLGWSQSDLATKARVSRKWISEFEAGKSRAELGIVLRVLDELGLTIDVRDRVRLRAAKNAVDLDGVLERHRTP